MSVLISNVSMKDYDDQSIPQVLTITFTNGAKVTFQRSSEEYSKPNLDLGEEKTEEFTYEALLKNYERRSSQLNDQHIAAIAKTERMFRKEMKDLDEFRTRQNKVLDEVRVDRKQEISMRYNELQKKLHSQMEALNDPLERLKIMIRWLKETDMEEYLKVADMLESHSGGIIKSINYSSSEVPETKWDSFLSHVQKFSADVCRDISDTLQKEGISTWCNRNVDGLDNHGVINGVVNSSLFTFILTKEYFGRPVCLFEFCVAAVAGKTVITVLESDPRYGGGNLSLFQVPELFKHIMQQEMTEINREYWEVFTKKLTKRMRTTLKCGPKGHMLKPDSENDLESSILDESEITWLAAELRKERRVSGKRLFKSSENGATAEEFHANCDGKGATLIVVQTSDGDIFGGFTSRPWDVSKEAAYHSAESAWLFKLRVGASKEAQRINIKPGRRRESIRDGMYYGIVVGPLFGAGYDLFINFRYGYVYCKQKSYAGGILLENGKAENLKLEEVEVFQVLNF